MYFKLFENWLSLPENFLFWKLPLASERLDDIIAQRDMQKSIAHSRENQTTYSFIEHMIVSDYATLIETKLDEAFHAINPNEYKIFSGFEREDKSSAAQKRYFNIRHHLEYFFKNDIRRNSNPDAQLNAFRRWIDISDELLKRHCYEGFLLIFVNLEVLAKPHLIAGLPKCTQIAYYKLLHLNSPDGNHSALRNYITENRSASDLPPLIFWYKALNVSNIALEKLKEKQECLLQDIERLDDRIDDLKMQHSRHRLRKARREKRTVESLINALSEDIHAQTKQSDNMISDIRSVKKKPALKIAPNHIVAYEIIKKRYEAYQQDLRERGLSTEPTTQRSANASTLYSSKLLPFFWTRKGKSSDEYWAELFFTNSGPK